MPEDAMLEGTSRPNQTDGTIVRYLMPLVLIGLIIVLFALALLRWPAGPDADGPGLHHLSRMLGPAPDGGPDIPRRLLDFIIYPVVLAGVGLLVMVLRRRSRTALIGLVAVGVLGLAYVNGMALYAGPMVSVCGFMLILFGGLVAWAGSSAPEETSVAVETPGGPSDEPGETSRPEVESYETSYETRTDDHASDQASHFAA
jgi:uncharacterized membrane protein